jgi:hypothetical protein
MAELNATQERLIATCLKVSGIADEGLHDELFDHLCTAVEDEMKAPKGFEEALGIALERFYAGEFRHVQEEVYAIVSPTHLNMKPITFIAGVLCALLLLFGMLFKVMHWPFTSLLIVLGGSLLVMPFLPLLLIHNLQKAEGAMVYGFHFSGYFGLTFFALGALFKVFHWPYASALLGIGVSILLLFYLPIYFYQRYKQTGNKSVAIATFMVTFSALALLYTLLPSDQTVGSAIYRWQHADAALSNSFAEINAVHSPSEPLEALYESLDAATAALLLAAGHAEDDLRYTGLSQLEQPQSKLPVFKALLNNQPQLEQLATAVEAYQKHPLHRGGMRPLVEWSLTEDGSVSAHMVYEMFNGLTLVEALQSLELVKVEAARYELLTSSLAP